MTASPRPASTPRRHPSDRGIATVELGLLVGVLALLVVAVAPLAGGLSAHHTIARATSEGLRIATKVQANPRDAFDGCPDRRRTDPATVVAAVRDAADIDDLDVTVEPASLCDAHPGARVEVSATHQHELGPLADAANGLAGVFGDGSMLPSSLTIETHAHGVRE